ncbi:MAG: hypothetical protein K2X10_00495 [Hyphomicrobiales bacterium]|nr:hypothetical protein [Hyphomicrobiales bacterium]OQW84881.1 MAG: hypothetical protein BVN31_02160 [Proteobacteria bacterium ST_bin15]
MSKTDTLFVTKLYAARSGSAATLADLETACRQLAIDDEAGRAWCLAHAYPGYTSYGSLNDLPWRFSVVKSLVRSLDRHVARFADEVGFDLGEHPLVLDSLWVNVLDPGGFHAGHLHPHSVVSGTFYVTSPEGAGAIRFEDPRLPAMMAAPPRRKKAGTDMQSFIEREPRPGSLLLWESWLRHEVRPNRASAERISISFNYRWR